MIIRWLLAATHLLGLGIGLGAVWARARALRSVPDDIGLKKVFYADTLWGVAAGIWIVTGLIRLFGSYEKPTSYYLHNHLFLTKMALLVVILVLEISPMVTLIRWRTQVRRSAPVDLGPAARLARISEIQALIIVLMVILATGMARGV